MASHSHIRWSGWERPFTAGLVGVSAGARRVSSGWQRRGPGPCSKRRVVCVSSVSRSVCLPALPNAASFMPFLSNHSATGLLSLPVAGGGEKAKPPPLHTIDNLPHVPSQSIIPYFSPLNDKWYMMHSPLTVHILHSSYTVGDIIPPHFISGRPDH